MDLIEWILAKLEGILGYQRVLICDPLGMLNEAQGGIDAMARMNGFTVISASTNLTFRDTYEKVLQDHEVMKIMVLDRTPSIRLQHRSVNAAPPLFYPDFLENVPEKARIHLDLRQYLRDVTGDGSWPQACNEPRHARLMIPNIKSVLTAFQNLRSLDKKRFTDSDFDTIVAFAALGMPELAFKKLGAEEYWRIGLMGHATMSELKNLAPNMVAPIIAELKKAPPPFCWFAERDPEDIVNGFYLAAILAQHIESWGLLLTNIDSVLIDFQKINPVILKEAAPRLVALDPVQAERDLINLEQNLDGEQLELILLEHLKIEQPVGFVAVIEKECFSSLFRSLALLMAFDNMLSDHPSQELQERIQTVLFNPDSSTYCLAEQRQYPPWQALREAYRLLLELEPLRKQLLAAQKILGVKKVEKLEMSFFRNLWIEKHLGHLDYLLSALERQVNSAELLPRHSNKLPELFPKIVDRIRQRVRSICNDTNYKIAALNIKFQEMVAYRYPSWAGSESDSASKSGPVLTSQFIAKALKPHWDPQTEKAVLFIFDGMRYDIWHLMIKDTLSEYMDTIQELPGCALLPTETHVSRKAVSAGAFPDEFDSTKGEDKLLQTALHQYYHQDYPVEVITPDGAGTGETVHYRTGNLDLYIFELCDTELHKIKLKTLADGREVPARPLAFIYQQQVKNIIDNEFMAIVRTLNSGTKVFVTADHGFARLGRKPLGLSESFLHNPKDCSYSNSMLSQPYSALKLSPDVKNNMIAFTPSQLRMPSKTTRINPKSGKSEEQQFASIVFPRIGYSFRRPGSPYKPDAFSHGGISMQEMLIPMVVLQVKQPDLGLISLGAIEGQRDVVEGETLQLSAHIDYQVAGQLFLDDIRVEVRAYYAHDPDQFFIPTQVLYIGTGGDQVSFSFRPDSGDASLEERQGGLMKRVFTLELNYRDGHRNVRKTRTHRFTLKLNSDRIIRRVPTHLGNILGLTPRNMR